MSVQFYYLYHSFKKKYKPTYNSATSDFRYCAFFFLKPALLLQQRLHIGYQHYRERSVSSRSDCLSGLYGAFIHPA